MRQSFPVRYILPVFRPPSEAQSLILPVTNSCSWSRCMYCLPRNVRGKSVQDLRAAEALGKLGATRLGTGAAMRRVAN